METARSEDLQVRRSDGRIEPFNREEALERSIALASARAIGEKAVSAVADGVVRRLDLRPRQPRSTEEIGFAVLQELLRANQLAALRYATIFLSSRGIATDPATLLSWMTSNLPGRPTPAVVDERPLFVVKRTGSRHQQGEDFMLGKL